MPAEGELAPRRRPAIPHECLVAFPSRRPQRPARGSDRPRSMPVPEHCAPAVSRPGGAAGCSSRHQRGAASGACSC